MTGMPRSFNRPSTKDFPVAMPPVKRHPRASATESSAQLRRRDRVRHEHRNCQRPDTARNGRESAGDVGNFRVHVSDQHRALALEEPAARMTFVKDRSRHHRIHDQIDADVDHGRSRPDERTSHKTGPAERCHENVAGRGNLRQILRAGMTDRHSRVAVKEEHRHGLPHDVAAPDHDRVFSGDVDAGCAAAAR